MSDEIGWVIERADSPGYAPAYLYVEASNFAAPYLGSNAHFGWTTEHLHALRFSREQDAALVMIAAKTFNSDLPHRLSLPGLRHDDPPPRICEHMWTRP